MELVEKDIIIKCPVEEMMKAFFKDYMIVWHDPNVNNQENQQYIAKLKKYCDVAIFTEWEKLNDFIQGTQTVCHVITSGTNGELLVKEIFENENVCNIYVFCENEEYHSSWAQNYHKVSCIETDIETVLYYFEQNLLEYENKVSSLKLNLPAFAPIFNDSDKSQMNNLHRYLKVLPNFQNREQAKNDFIALSKLVYSDPINTELLEEFEKNYIGYNKEQALRWYTQESFLYKVTNNCLRIATSDSIQYCRFILKDLERAIKEQYQTESKTFHGLLYRGAYLSQEEWSSLKENIGQEIETHGFLSASKEKNIALNFMQSDPSKKIFITIIVPKGPNEQEQGFADVNEYSQFHGEREFLFNVRSRFTVLEMEEESQYRHLVLLYGAQGFRRFITEQNPILEVSILNSEKILCTHCKIKSESQTQFFVSVIENHSYYCKNCIGHGVGPFLCIPIKDKSQTSFTAKINGCLLRMNSSSPFYGYKCSHCQESKRQKAYFICTETKKRWCENCFDNNNNILDCHKSQDQILLETNPFSFWCEKMSLDELNHWEFHNDSVAKTLNIFSPAEMYFETHEYEKATEYYNLYIQQNEAKGTNSDLATAYNNLANIYNIQGWRDKALEYYLKSLEIYQSVHGDNHPDVATSYNNIGLRFNNQGEYQKALEYYLKSLDIRKSVYGENHSHTAASYNNIGQVYHDQGEYKKALEYHFKSLDIYKSLYGDNHPDTATSYNNIGLVYSNQGETNKALEYYLKALEIDKSLYGDNHSYTAISYNNIGCIYEGKGECKKALEYYLKSLDIRKSIYRDSHPDIAISYNNIGSAYHTQGEYKKALEYYFKSLDIYKSIYGDLHPNIAISYDNIGDVYEKQGEYKMALECYLKCLDIKKSVYGDHHSRTIEIQNKIFRVKSISEI